MKKNILILYIIILLSCISTNIKSAQTPTQSQIPQIIILKNGREYKGFLEKITAHDIHFIINGKQESFKKSEVAGIQFSKNRLYQNASTINDIPDEDIKEAWQTSKTVTKSDNKEICVLLDKITLELLSRDRLKITVKKIIKILNESGKEVSTQYFHYMKNDAQADLLYAFSIQPGGTVTTIEEQAINDEPVFNDVSHYDRLKRIKFGFKDIALDTIICWETQITKTIDHLSTPFLYEKQLLTSHDVKKREITLIAPTNIKTNIHFYEGLLNKPTVKKSTSYQNNKKVTTYLQSDVKAFINDETETPSDDLIYPKIYISPRSSWQEITHKYYKTYFSNDPPNSIIKKTKEIIGNETDQSVIIKKLYNHINYTIIKSNIPMRHFRFTPHDETELISLPSLNILDKSYLFTMMCRTLNIPVKMYLYRKNFKDPATNHLTSLKLFDSALCEVSYAGKNIYMSFENSNFSPGQRYYSSSGSECLELTTPGATPGRLSRLPYNYDQTIVNYECTLNHDNSLQVIKTLVLNGPSQSWWRAKRFLSYEELDKLMKKRVGTMGTDVTLNDYTFVNSLNDFSKPVIIEEIMLIKNFSFSSGDNYKLLKLLDFTYDAGRVTKNKRVLPFDFGVPHSTIKNYSITFPNTMEIKYIPKPIVINNDDYSFKTAYSLNGNKLLITIHDKVVNPIIPTDRYIYLKSSIENMAKLSKEWILLGVTDEK